MSPIECITSNKKCDTKIIMTCTFILQFVRHKVILSRYRSNAYVHSKHTHRRCRSMFKYRCHYSREDHIQNDSPVSYTSANFQFIVHMHWSIESISISLRNESLFQLIRHMSKLLFVVQTHLLKS